MDDANSVTADIAGGKGPSAPPTARAVLPAAPVVPSGSDSVLGATFGGGGGAADDVDSGVFNIRGGGRDSGSVFSFSGGASDIFADAGDVQIF